LKLAWVSGWISSLPATILTLFQGAYFKPMQLALLQLLAAVYLAIISDGVGFRMGIFSARYDFEIIFLHLFHTDAGGTTAATRLSLFGDN
jgi:hypothetical protein